MPRPKIFISYSHKDEQEKDALLAQLRALRHQADVWHDDRIGAGENWEQKINEAMEQASVAVLLITANFLASDTIERLELPKLLARHEKDGLPIVPIIARFCAWEVVDWLAPINVRPKNGTPVWSRNSDAHEELYKIALEIVAILKAEEQRRTTITPTQSSTTRDNSTAQPTQTTQASERGVAIGGDQSGVVVTGNVQNLYINTPAPEREKAALPLSSQERGQGGEVLTLAPNLTLALVRVPVGEFLMGSDKGKDKDADNDELPQHKVHLDAYLIGKYPVTVAQFAAFVNATKHKTQAEKEGSSYTWTGSEWKEVKGADWQHPRGPKSDVRQKQNHPVTHISWDDARVFCEWASEVTGRSVRLPTEAEWEKAARGGLPSPFQGEGQGVRVYPWGDQSPTDHLCNFGMNVKDTTPVGQYSPQGDSPYGCADMAGNVWEWTSSLFTGYKYDATDGRENLEDRSGARVLRGGSFIHQRRLVRCAFRNGGARLSLSEDNGLRIFCAPSL